MHELLKFMTQHGGVVDLRQIVDAGLRPRLRVAIRSGRLRPIRRGVYATERALPAAVAAATAGARLCGLTAAGSYGLWSGREVTRHWAVPRHRSRPPAGAVLHWIELPPQCDCWRVDLEVCLRQVVAWAPVEDAVACLDTAVTRYGVDLQAVFTGARPRDRLVVARAHGGCDSGPESVVGQRLLAAGIRVRRQVQIPGVGRVDMLVGRLVIEVDGYEFHSGRDSFEEDRRRDALLVASGFRVLRFTYRQVFGQWPTCLERVRAALI